MNLDNNCHLSAADRTSPTGKQRPRPIPMQKAQGEDSVGEAGGHNPFTSFIGRGGGGRSPTGGVVSSGGARAGAGHVAPWRSARPQPAPHTT